LGIFQRELFNSKGIIEFTSSKFTSSINWENISPNLRIISQLFTMETHPNRVIFEKVVMVKNIKIGI